MLARSWLASLKSRFMRTLNRQERRATRGLTTRDLQVETLEDRSLLAFDLAVNYSAGANPQAVVSGDFNNDGRPDIATANYSDNTVSVLLANANGTFQAAQNSAAGIGPLSVAVGDFNADGKLDLASANSGDVSLLLGNGDGSFQAPANINIGSLPRSLAVGDFNADGKLDLGIASNVYYPGSYGWYGWYSGSYSGRANVLLGNGAGAFAAPLTNYVAYGYHTSAAVADFNGDGRLDFAVTNVDYGSVFVLPGVGDGSLGATTSFYAGYYPYAVAAGDINGDGKVDLLTANYSGNNISVLLGTGVGSFADPEFFAAGSQPSSLALADYNNDGQVDVATSNVGANTISVLLGAGAGAFTPPVSSSAGSYPLALAVGDFNGDGRPDAASANNSSSNNVLVLLNNGTWPAVDSQLLTINNVTVVEGNTGTTAVTFKVTLSAVYNQVVTVDYATVDGSATVAGGDYQAQSGTLTFGIGETSKDVTVLVNGDRLAESYESFSVHLSNPTNAFIGNPVGVGTITDDEPHLSIDYGPVALIEGNSGSTNAQFTVRLSAPYDAPVSVNLSTVEGDTDFPYWGYYGYYESPPFATSNIDFQAATSTLTFAPGETVKIVPITIHGDRIGEVDEYFSVNLSNPSLGTLDAAHAVGIILNDEPYASISSASGAEGNTGTTSLIFTVTLSAAPTAPVTVDYSTADATATLAGSDYQTKTGTLTFGVGETSKTITVLVNGDRLAESDEYFLVNLTGASGASIGSGTAYGTILDNEPRLSINSVSRTEGNSGTKLMAFTVTLSSVYDQNITVNYATFNSSATAGSDYLATSGTLTFTPGQKTKTINVTIKGDKQKESDEAFYVLLSLASSNALIADAYGWGTILNDESGRRH